MPQRAISLVQLTFSFLRLRGYFAHDGGVGHDYNEKWNEVHSYHAKEVVGNFLAARREKSESDALLEIGIIGMRRNVENNTLKQKKKKISRYYIGYTDKVDLQVMQDLRVHTYKIS